MICLAAWRHARSRSVGVAADGAGQAEALAQRAGGRTPVRKAPSPLQRRHDAVDDGVEVVAGHARAAGGSPSTPWSRHVDEQVGQLVGVPAKIAASRAVRSRRRARRGAALRAAAAAGVVVEEHDEVGEDPQRRPRPPDRLPRRRGRRPTQRATSASSAGVTNTTSADVAANSNGTGGWASAATSGWPCGGRGTIDGPFTREEAALEVDVVQLVAVDEAAGGDVLDDRRRPPSCPTAGGRPRRRRPPRRTGRRCAPRRGRRGRGSTSARAPPDEGGLGRPDRHLRPPAGRALADAVEGGDGRGDVERLGVGRVDRRARSPMCVVTGAISEAMSTASRRPRTWSVRSSRRRERADCSPNESSMVTKSSRPRSAVRARSTQYAAVNSSVGRAAGSRHAAGCHPAPSSATARWTCRSSAAVIGGGRRHEGTAGGRLVPAVEPASGRGNDSKRASSGTPGWRRGHGRRPTGWGYVSRPGLIARSALAPASNRTSVTNSRTSASVTCSPSRKRSPANRRSISANASRSVPRAARPAGTAPRRR